MPNTNRTLYDILGVQSSATEKEIKTAYRKKAMEHHPDRNADGDSEEFKNIKHAYEILSNADKRRRYDETGQSGEGESVVERLMRGAVEATFDSIRNVTFQDFITALRKLVKSEIKDIDKKLRRVREDINSCEEVVARTKSKKGSSKLFIRALDERKLGLLSKEQSGEQMRSEMKTLLSHMEGHSYEIDDIPEGYTEEEADDDVPEFIKMLMRGH